MGFLWLKEFIFRIICMDIEDINTYPLQQPLVQKNNVVIGEGTWLGERVSVIGAKIGKHCVIGTGALVLNDIPAYVWQ